jgi:hypothetical protein
MTGSSWLASTSGTRPETRTASDREVPPRTSFRSWCCCSWDFAEGWKRTPCRLRSFSPRSAPPKGSKGSGPSAARSPRGGSSPFRGYAYRTRRRRPIVRMIAAIAAIAKTGAAAPIAVHQYGSLELVEVRNAPTISAVTVTSGLPYRCST